MSFEKIAGRKSDSEMVFGLHGKNRLILATLSIKSRNYLCVSEHVLLNWPLEKSFFYNQGNDMVARLFNEMHFKNFHYNLKSFKSHLNVFLDEFSMCWVERKFCHKDDINLVFQFHHRRYYCCLLPAHIQCFAGF